MMSDFTKCDNTVVLSDIHLSDAELPKRPGRGLWKRFKRPEFFVDQSFRRFLSYILENSKGTVELILNGDIFDFDSVMVIPRPAPFKVKVLERFRGLMPEEEKSRFKMKVILGDHPIWVKALRDFIIKGNRVVFVIGNHDAELHWTSVRDEIVHALDLSEDYKKSIRFCEWFYISNQDTLIEHGNQYDAYCMCLDPIHPLVRRGSKVIVRLPFGNLAGKFMINGMGLLNPHVESSFIMSIGEYTRFFFKYLLRIQPFILWSWFWSAFVTLYYSLKEGFLPPLKDPLTVENRIEDIAQRSNTTPIVVRLLREIHVHPAIFNPFMIMRELWLDRAILLGAAATLSFQFFSFLNVFFSVSIWFFVVPLTLLMALVIFYARSVESDVYAVQKNAIKNIPICTQIARVKRVIQGHTHRELHFEANDGLELLNTGTWSPAFKDVECTRPYGRKCFAWIRPEGFQRKAELYEWKDPGIEKINSVQTDLF